MRAAAYCRVSTSKEEQLDSLESQQKFFAEYAVKNAYELVNIYADEGKSGTKMKNRTQLLKLLSDAALGSFEVVLIKDISRLARNTVDFLTSIRKLRGLNVRVIFVNYDQTSSDSSEFMLTMLSAIAQEESANTSKRVRFGKKQNAEQGRVPNLIFGYDKTPGDYFHLNINKTEAQTVKRIFELYTEHHMGANRIAVRLNKEGIKTKRGCNFTQNAISRILSNEIYTGKVINGKQEIEDFLTGKRKKREENQWQVVTNTELKIISEEVFHKAQKIRESRSGVFCRSDNNSRSNGSKCNNSNENSNGNSNGNSSENSNDNSSEKSNNNNNNNNNSNSNNNGNGNSNNNCNKNSNSSNNTSNSMGNLDGSNNSKGNYNKYLFSQLLRCNQCGSAFRRLVRTYKNTYITWVCNGRNSNGTEYCPNKTAVDEEKLSEAVRDYFLLVIRENPVIALNAVKEYSRKTLRDGDAKEKEQDCSFRVNKHIRDKQKYMDMYTNEIITIEELKEKTNQLNSEIKKLKLELEIYKTQKNKKPDTYTNNDFLEKITELFGNPDICGCILRKLIDRIEIDKTGKMEVYIKLFT
jgi:DNA invertase Pin-like site-specific DNA recombinase